MLVEIWIQAGLPPDVINVIQTRREDAPAVTEALIAHPAIRKVEFVGSASVGKLIGSLAGKYLKPILMELGGKCAAVVLEDANFEDAATKCITGGKKYLRALFRDLKLMPAQLSITMVRYVFPPSESSYCGPSLSLLLSFLRPRLFNGPIVMVRLHGLSRPRTRCWSMLKAKVLNSSWASQSTDQRLAWLQQF